MFIRTHFKIQKTPTERASQIGGQSTLHWLAIHISLVARQIDKPCCQWKTHSNNCIAQNATCTECPHVGLTHPGHISCKWHSQVPWEQPHCQLPVKQVAQESNKHISTDDTTTLPVQHNGCVCLTIAFNLNTFCSVCLAQHELSL